MSSMSTPTIRIIVFIVSPLNTLSRLRAAFGALTCWRAVHRLGVDHTPTNQLSQAAEYIRFRRPVFCRSAPLANRPLRVRYVPSSLTRNSTTGAADRPASLRRAASRGLFPWRRLWLLRFDREPPSYLRHTPFR